MSRILTDEEMDERYLSPDNLTTQIIHHQLKRGRGPSIEVPLEIKKVLAQLTKEESTRNLGNEFDISHNAVAAYGRGQTSSDGPPVQSLVEVIEDKRKEAEDLAIDALMETMGLLKPKLSGVTKAKELSSIAKDMASVAETLRVKKIGEGNSNVNFHIYAPQQASLEDYEAIDV